MYGLHGGWNPAGAGYAFGIPFGAILMGLLAIALIVLVVFATLRLAKGGHHGHGPAPLGEFPPERRALDILAERFARGEIDAESYRLMKAELERKD